MAWFDGDNWFEGHWWDDNWWAGQLTPKTAGGDGSDPCAVAYLIRNRRRPKPTDCPTKKREPNMPPPAVVLAALED